MESTSFPVRSCNIEMNDDDVDQVLVKTNNAEDVSVEDSATTMSISSADDDSRNSEELSISLVKLEKKQLDNNDCNYNDCNYTKNAAQEKEIIKGDIKTDPNFVYGDDDPTFIFCTPSEWLSFFVGATILLIIGPAVGSVVLGSLIWEAFDRGFAGGFINCGRELTGFVFTSFLPWLNKVTYKFNLRFVKHESDTFMMNCIFGHGVLVPAMFMGCAWHCYHYGFDARLAFAYHLLRIGPHQMNFAYVYTLCHKEGHNFSGLYKKPYNDSVLLRNVFNWWIGLFYGVVPATFAYGHSINHHKYDNEMRDVTTTSDKPRDSFINWVAYVTRYFLYAINITTISQFISEGRRDIAWKTFNGTLYFLMWNIMWAFVVSPSFALLYVSFPFWEATILLAAINWSWHAFIEPEDLGNDYVQSLTILDGRVNVLNEDAHVIHHCHPAAHWTTHPDLVSKRWNGYVSNAASVFRGTHAFEIFGMSVARDYDALAEKFVDLKGERDGNLMTHDETVKMIKRRLRGVWWGPRLESQTRYFEGKHPCSTCHHDVNGDVKKEL